MDLGAVCSDCGGCKSDNREQGTEKKGGYMAPGSTAFCPSVAGLLMAAAVVNDLVNDTL